jgi:hypothetical protein
MMFFGDHKLDFMNTDIDSLENYAISELNKIPINIKLCKNFTLILPYRRKCINPFLNMLQLLH